MLSTSRRHRTWTVESSSHMGVHAEKAAELLREARRSLRAEQECPEYFGGYSSGLPWLGLGGDLAGTWRLFIQAVVAGQLDTPIG